MGQEFFIKSTNLESKVRDLLPSQGGLGAGFDLSASTQIVPIVDLTESAEGSNIREDLQRSLSFDTVTTFTVSNASRTTIVNNTGYYRVFGCANINGDTTNGNAFFELSDGATFKIIFQATNITTAGVADFIVPFDFMVFLQAGDSLVGSTTNAQSVLSGCTRQIASIDGTLTAP